MRTPQSQGEPWLFIALEEALIIYAQMWLQRFVIARRVKDIPLSNHGR
jgi:hypothetical protein